MPSLLSEGIVRVKELAYKNPERRFTSLLHHATLQVFERAFEDAKQNAAYGADTVQWNEYAAENLTEKLKALRENVFNGTYKPLSCKRMHNPEQDEKRMRVIGIAAIEDTIVQNVVKMIIEPLYESIFCEFSYGFRPGRSRHDAFDALCASMTCHRIQYVLYAAVRGYSDSVLHGKLLSLITLRTGDSRIRNLIKKWLKCGILENMPGNFSDTGTVQGAVLGPLLIDIYLHYALDTWAQEWRRDEAKGDVSLIRCADNVFVNFQYQDDAEKFLTDLGHRLGQYALLLQTDTCRLTDLRKAREKQKIRGGDPGTCVEMFDLLGISHIFRLEQEGVR